MSEGSSLRRNEEIGEPSNIVECQAVSKLKQLEALLDYFIKIYESPISLFKMLDNEAIKKSFQIASVIEKSIDSYEDANKTNLVGIMVTNKDMPPNYDTNFFMKACDSLLGKFFMLNEDFLFQTDIAVRVYTSILPPPRFNTFLLELLMESASHQAIQEFIFENEDIDIKTLQFKLILQDWIPEYEEGRNVELTEVIQGMMSSYNSGKSLHILIGIIAIETESENEMCVRELVHQEVLQKMYCRSKLSRDFWLSLFAVDTIIVTRACQLSEQFHASLCKFLIFIGSMMEEDDEANWVPLSTSIYPELNYKFLVTVFRQLSNVEFSRRDATIRILFQAEEETNCPLWKQLIKIL